MRVLIACEESQTVCKAFRERGHEAYSYGRAVGIKIKAMKKYRTEWTIEPDNFIGGGTVHWFRGTYDGDTMNTCGSVEEAEREIDDAIIHEQEQIIEKLRDALRDSNSCLKGVRDVLGSMSTLDNQISSNELILKHIGV